MNGVSLDFDNAIVINSLRMMIVTASPTRNKVLMPVIDAHLVRLSKIVSLEFPDNEADVDILKMKAKMAIIKIEELKKQVPL